MGCKHITFDFQAAKRLTKYCVHFNVMNEFEKLITFPRVFFKQNGMFLLVLLGQILKAG